VLLELGKDGAMLEFEFDQYPAEFEEDFLLWRLEDDLLQLLLDLLAEFVALGEFTRVVVAAGKTTVDHDLPEAVDVLQDVLPQLTIGKAVRRACPRIW
jgi:hypothetical protein